MFGVRRTPVDGCSSRAGFGLALGEADAPGDPAGLGDADAAGDISPRARARATLGSGEAVGALIAAPIRRAPVISPPRCIGDGDGDALGDPEGVATGVAAAVVAPPLVAGACAKADAARTQDEKLRSTIDFIP